MNARGLVVTLAAIGIPVALAVALLPITWGYGGYYYGNLGVRGNIGSSSGTGKLFYVDPNGPAYRAGVRQGETIVPSTGSASILDIAGPAGSVVPLHIVRKDGVHTIPVTFEPFHGTLAAQQQIDKVLGALTALAAFIVAILVALRARERDAGVRASAFLLLAGFGALSPAIALVCHDAWAAWFFHNILPSPIAGGELWTGLSLLAIYPPHRTRLRDNLVWAGLAALVWGVLTDASFITRVFAPQLLPVFGILLGNVVGFFIMPFVFRGILAVQIVAAMRAARGPYRTPMAWLGGMWLTALVLTALPPLVALAGSNILLSHRGDFIDAASVFCLTFGVAYPVLRHRLVDLNIFITRATVYAIVSAIIVGAFIAAEWALGKIFEHSLGFSSDTGGIATQIISLVLVLILGISARSIHRFVEDRLTNTFFRKRMDGLATIERLAREADAATDLRAYTDLAVKKVEQSLETLGAAFYLRAGDRYDRSSHAGASIFPDSYGFNDEAPLALRRWHKPFELADGSEEHNHTLCLPMSVRGELLGFLCCGPKADHTAFLNDETSALALLAERAGIASALLSRATLPAFPAAIRTSSEA